MITKFSKAMKLKVGRIIAFDHNNDALYYIQDKNEEIPALYVQELLGNLPPRPITKQSWESNNTVIVKVLALDEMEKLEATILTLIGLVSDE